MKRSVAGLLVLVAVWLSGLRPLTAQDTSADRFLERVAKHPTGDETERDQYLTMATALDNASSADVARVLPSVLQHARGGNEIHVRVYATGFLLGIAQRHDGADLLSSNSDDISSLILDADPTIQRTAIATTDYVIGRSGTDNRPYLSALMVGIQKRQTPQDIAVEMAGPLISIGSADPNAVKAVLDFLRRDDLSVATRTEVLHSVATIGELPREVAQCLSKSFDDPDPKVRAAAVIAFAMSNSTFHDLVKDRVEKMAKDPTEHPQVRDLAQQALAGHTPLNPNIDVTSNRQ